MNEGGEGGAMRVINNRSRMCAQNYSGAQIIVPRQGLMPGSSPVPGLTGDWGVELHRSFVIMTSRPRMHYDKWVHPF